MGAGFKRALQPQRQVTGLIRPAGVNNQATLCYGRVGGAGVSVAQAFFGERRIRLAAQNAAQFVVHGVAVVVETAV